jgi:dTDP-4-amino-4,6-dideoxygalactose transaminase
MEIDDRKLATRLLFSPGQWRKGASAVKLEQWFTNYTGAAVAKSFTSGRGALYAILKALNLPQGSEVLLQAYTCVAVPDPVLWAKLQPVYVDCDESLMMSAADLEKKITAQSKVLIIQHTFGQPADMGKLMELARKHNLFVIEDCAHALGAMHGEQKLGTFGDAAFFSFGRDKVLSAVFGGVAIINESRNANHISGVGERLSEIHKASPLPSRFWVWQQLMHPIILSFAKRFYDTLSIGKIKLELAKRLHIITKAVYPEEKTGGAPTFVFRRMPEASAQLALHQLSKLERFNTHRRQLAFYYEGALRLIGLKGVAYKNGDGIFLRYAVFHPKAHDIIVYARARGVELGDWYTTPIAPKGVDYKAIGYTVGSCPVAELMSQETFNLPTHIGISRADGEYIVELLKKFLF